MLASPKPEEGNFNRRLTWLRRVAMADDEVVLPTPPFPPTKMNLRSSPPRPRAEWSSESSDMAFLFLGV